MKLSPMLVAAGILGAFAVFGVGLVAVTYGMTAPMIAANERAAVLREVRAILPPGELDNDPIEDRLEISDPVRLGAQVTQVYRARRDGDVVAVVLDPVVGNGYSGPIRLLVSVLADGSLGGVRVLSHRETPGLGDRIEVARSDWILGFSGRSLGNPPAEDWEVRRDGGEFDQFTGATITPRAVVRAVRGALELVAEQRAALFAAPVVATGPSE
ncbi:MAG: electron transport complex subunit RsxG [Chromatiaceae bacterium]|jgi:electron transport complex protein RnfG|nr:electron transport complex subunit RsxG [Chromatiaceae bacterium]